MRLADRVRRLETRTGAADEQAREREAAAAAFIARIEAISAGRSEAEQIEACHFRDHILAGGDPFLIRAFATVVYGDWQL